MSKIDYRLASSLQIAEYLGQRLADNRLARNITQKRLSEMAGVSLKTVQRLEKGENSSLDTLIRVLKAMGVAENLDVLLPDASIRPLERVKLKGKERQRARPVAEKKPRVPWVWGEDRP